MIIFWEHVSEIEFLRKQQELGFSKVPCLLLHEEVLRNIRLGKGDEQIHFLAGEEIGGEGGGGHEKNIPLIRVLISAW